MKRRQFFQNLVGSFALLVEIYSSQFGRVKRDAVSEFLRDGATFDQIQFGPKCWVGLVRRGRWPAGMGDTIRAIPFERNA